MFVKYPSIESLKNIQYHVAKLRGTDKPDKISMIGTTKVHGTNGGVTLDTRTGELFVQSRNRLLELGNDNAGFYQHVLDNESGYRQLLQSIDQDLADKPLVTLYGEWCGGNIQKNVGVSGMEKSFIIFGAKVSDDHGEGDWVLSPFPEDIINAGLANKNVYLIGTFKNFFAQVDITSQEDLDKLTEMTLEVEANCPVADKLNPEGNGIGEGIVWQFNYKGEFFMFKHKGDKHQREGGSKKLKAGKSYTEEQQQVLDTLYETALTNDRLLQGLEYLTEMGLDHTPESTGQYIKWVMSDIHKECQPEITKLEEVELSWKSVTKPLTTTVAQFYREPRV